MNGLGSKKKNYLEKNLQMCRATFQCPDFPYVRDFQLSFMDCPLIVSQNEMNVAVTALETQQRLV